MKHQPLVAVVLVNWNGLADTKECLNSLNRISYNNYRTIVVDNGSVKSESKCLLKLYPKIKLISNKHNFGFSYANNQAIKLAIRLNAKYILLLNNDTIVRKNFLDVLVKYAESHYEKFILTPKILYYKTSTIWAMGGSLNIFTSIPRMINQGKKSAKFTKIISPDYVSGCALFTPTKLFNEIGNLDENLFAYYEDTDISYRAKKAGYNLKVLPKSIIWHKVSRSTQQKDIKKIGNIQSFLLAKNGVIFGYINLNGIKRIIYLTSQLVIKFPLYLLFKCDGFSSRFAYSKGIYEGYVKISKEIFRLPQ